MIKQQLGRRTETRYSWWSPCALNLEDTGEIQATSLDVSLRGASILGKIDADEGDMVEFRFAMFPSEDVVSMLGTVMWIQHQGDYSVVGLRFSEEQIYQLSWVRLINNASLVSDFYTQAA